MKKQLLLALCGLTVPFALSAQVVVFGFETLDNIVVYPDSDSTFQLSTTGVTEGDFALEVTTQSFWDFRIEFPDPSAVWTAMDQGGGILTIDVTSNEATGNTGFWGLMSVAIQGDGVNLTQISDIGIWDTNGTTITLDFSSVDLSNAGPDWGLIDFSINANPGTTHYLDNLVVIPEPRVYAAALGLLGLAFAVYRRRRQR